ncbi:MAG: ABC transporter substrate-binding protein, partial [Alphaproteobacteria bacterium]
LDPETGSSSVGLMKGYMLEEFETGEVDDKGNPKKSHKLWDANAIEKIDDHTVRLNLKVPHVAIPEDLFHYTNSILDPEEGGFLGPARTAPAPSTWST